MKTYFSYAPDIEEDAIVIKRIPQDAFECPKMSPGDFMDFDIVQRNGNHILTPVKVSHVSISVSWFSYKVPSEKKIIKEAEQFVFVTPEIFSNKEVSPNIESTKRIRSK